MQKRKILFFLMSAVGGAERMTVNIAKMMALAGYSVIIVAIGKTFPILDFVPSNIKTIKLSHHNFNFLTLRIIKLIIQEKPDLTFSSSVFCSPRVIIASKLLGKKVLVRSSGMVGRYRKADYLKIRFTYPLATMLIAQQEEMRQEMSKLLNIPLERIVTLNNPLDVNTIEERKSAPSPYRDSNCIRYVNVSRVKRVKGHDIAILAFAKVIKAIPNAHLYFVGNYDIKDNYYKQLVDLLTKLKLQNVVHFVGYDSNPYRWIANANCFVFPSKREGLPNALIEASYIGVPCVATRCLNIISDIIHDGYNGYTTEVDDVNAIAESMIKAINLKDYTMTYHPSSDLDFINLFKHLCEK